MSGKVHEIASQCYAAAYNADMELVAVVVDKAILFRLQDYLHASQLREAYLIAGLHLVHESVLLSEMENS